ncbi:hypothetical protein BDZ91DRAFT_733853 [Kalaharituber pfeilii]|nr:hypothetical protein BDZ91DRAFT_733853 [Kalaharituber pfeilii]
MEVLVTIEAIGLRSIAGRWRKNFGGTKLLWPTLFFLFFSGSFLSFLSAAVLFRE